MDKFKSGVFINEGLYKSFHPEKINRVWEIHDMALLECLSKADRMLGRLDMYSSHIPNLDLFIQMHILKEATLSSRIEGTQTNMEDALSPEEEIPMEKRDDWAEVQNYIRAMNVGIESLQSLPLSCRLLRDVHRILMQGGTWRAQAAWRVSHLTKLDWRQEHKRCNICSTNAHGSSRANE